MGWPAATRSPSVAILSKPFPRNSMVSRPRWTIISIPPSVAMPKACPPSKSLTRMPETGATASPEDPGTMAQPRPAIPSATTSSGTSGRGAPGGRPPRRIPARWRSPVPPSLRRRPRPGPRRAARRGQILGRGRASPAALQEAVYALGDPVALGAHDDLGDLAALDHSRGAALLEPRVVYAVGVVHEEPQARDATLDALNVLATAQGTQDVLREHVVPVALRGRGGGRRRRAAPARLAL